MARYSYKREAILNCVRSARTHPSADWVFAQLKPRIPDLSLGTVYRNLGLFKQQGLVRSVGVVEGLERFDGCTQPHAHFICSACAAVLDVEELALPEDFGQAAMRARGAELRACEITLRGLCAHCREQQQHSNQNDTEVM